MVQAFLVQLVTNRNLQFSARGIVGEPKKRPIQAEAAAPVQPKRRLVAVNECGQRIGQDHPRAVLTDHQIDLLLDLRDEGWGYRRLAKVFQISRTAVKRYCKGEMRAQHAARYKRV